MACLLAMVIASPAASANLIVNGDFEDQPVTNSGGTGFDYVLSLTGWTVTDNSGPYRGAVLFDSAYGQPVGGGAQSLQLEDHLDTISQSIATVIGQEYALTFDLGAYSSPGSSRVNVGIDASSFAYTGTSSAYVTYTRLFTATSTSTSISFASDVDASHRYPHLDNISVVARVPEPASIALLAVGLLGAGMGRGRRA